MARAMFLDIRPELPKVVGRIIRAGKIVAPSQEITHLGIAHLATRNIAALDELGDTLAKTGIIHRRSGKAEEGKILREQILRVQSKERWD